MTPVSSVWRIQARTESGWAWDVEKVRFFDRSGKVQVPIAALSSSEHDDSDYNPEHAIMFKEGEEDESDGMWGGRKDSNEQLWIGAVFGRKTTITKCMFQDCGEHMAKSGTVVLEYKSKSGDWVPVETMGETREMDDDCCVHTLTKTVEESNVWRIRAETHSGWAWDVASVRFYNKSGKLLEPVAPISSGDMEGGDYNADNAVMPGMPEDDIWGGRQDASNDIWIGGVFPDIVEVGSVQFTDVGEHSALEGTVFVEFKLDGEWIKLRSIRTTKREPQDNDMIEWKMARATSNARPAMDSMATSSDARPAMDSMATSRSSSSCSSRSPSPCPEDSRSPSPCPKAKAPQASPTPAPKYFPTVFARSNFNPQVDAHNLRAAMKGWGCNKDAVFNTILKNTGEQNDQVFERFQAEFGGRDLKEDLKSELRGKLKDLMLLRFGSTAELCAKFAREAMKGLGTDEEVLTEILVSKTNEQMRELIEAYKRLYNRDLLTDVMSETSGHYERCLVSLLAGSRDKEGKVDDLAAREDAHALFQAGEARWGTDESKFNEVMCTRAYDQLRLIMKHYKRISSGITLQESIKNEFSGDAEKAFLALADYIEDPAKYYAVQLKSCMGGMYGVGTDDAKMMRIMTTRCEIDLASIKKKYGALYGDLDADVRHECTSSRHGAYERALLALLHTDITDFQEFTSTLANAQRLQE